MRIRRSTVSRALAAVLALAAASLAGAQGRQGSSAPARLRAPQADTMYGMPVATDLASVDADVVFIGVPSELGRNALNGAGSSLGPAAIRRASMIGGPGRQGDGIFDRETGETMLQGVRLVDGGDVVAPTGLAELTLQGVTNTVATIVRRNAMPVVLGGDHSITFGVLRGFKDAGTKIHVIHFDAHQDFAPTADRATGQTIVSQGNHLSHALELPWISGITMLGLRGLSRGSGQTAEQVHARQIETVSSSQIIRLGPAATVARIPAAEAYYVTLDIDVLDPAVAPGTGTPVPGGLSYYQLCDVLSGIAAKGRVVGFDVMEVTPPSDVNGRTSQVAAFVTMRFLGAVFQNRKAAAR